MPDDIQPDETANWLERLESAKLGDRESLEWILQHYWRPLWDQAASGMGDESRTVQETLIDAQNSLRDFRGQTPMELRAWLQSIMTSSIRDAWRATTDDRRPSSAVQTYNAIFNPVSPDWSASAAVVNHADEAAIKEGTPKLPGLLRAVEPLNPPADTSTAVGSAGIQNDSQVDASESASENCEFRPSSRYQLISRLGQGGFGVVFLARDQHLNRNVALKMPRPDVLLTKSMVQRFLREARNVAKLDHPNIVPVLATDETALMPSIVYPYCSGPNLGAWLHRCKSPPDFRVVATIVRLLAEAVQHAHSRGILHRDLKLANVLLEPTSECNQHHCFCDGELNWIPRVTDFGISKATQADDDVTVTGNVMGTLEYMAPEQIRGLTSDIGSHSDVYSLGVILYELLVKQRPYLGESCADMILKMKDAGPPLVRKFRPEVPRDLEAIVSRCLSVSIDHRYATAAGLAEDLTRFLEARPVLARKNSVAVRLSHWIRRQPMVAALGGLCVVLALAAISVTAGFVSQVSSSVVALSTMNKQLQASRDLVGAERDRATSSARKLRNQLYVADITAAARALEDGDLPSYDILLSRQISSNPEEDLRELTWYYLWNKGHLESESINVSKRPLYSVQFSNRGDLLALCGAEGVVSVYDARSFQKVTSWHADQGEVNLAAFSADDLMLATAGDDGTVCIWDSRTGKPVKRFRAHPGQAFHSLFGRDDTLISCGNEETIRIWNWRTGEAIKDLHGHTKTVQSIALSADRKQLFSASDDGTRGIWDLTTLELCRRLDDVGSRVLDVQPANGFPYIFSSDLDGTVRREHISAAETPNLSIDKVTDSAECIAVSLDGRRIAVANRSGMIHVVELDDNLNPINAADSQGKRAWSAHSGRIYDIAFSPDGTILNSVGHDGVLRAWKIEADRQTTSVGITHLAEPSARGPKIVQTQPNACVFSFGRNISHWNPRERFTTIIGTTAKPISRFVASISKDMVFSGEGEGLVTAWQLDDKLLKPVWSFAWPEASTQITGLAYSEARNWIASAIELPRNRVNLIHADTGILIRELQFPPDIGGDNNGDLAFSADGMWLAAAIGNQVVLFDLQSGKTKCLSGHASTVTAIAFHPQTPILASGSSDRAVKFWNVVTGAEEAVLLYHKETVTSVLFSADGQSLLSSDHDGCTAVWHTASARFLLQLDKHNKAVNLSRNWTGPMVFRGLEYTSLQADFLQIGVGK
jgi:eukaryotic-like serine/threonine-protein kinase